MEVGCGTTDTPKGGDLKGIHAVEERALDNAGNQRSPWIGVLTRVSLPSGFVKMKSRTGLPIALNSDTPTLWKRVPAGKIGSKNLLDSFSRGPL